MTKKEADKTIKPRFVYDNQFDEVIALLAQQVSLFERMVEIKEKNPKLTKTVSYQNGFLKATKSALNYVKQLKAYHQQEINKIKVDKQFNQS